MQTLDVYGKVAFPMPYPSMQSVNGPVGGMEYPMITFNGPRPEEDGTYGERTKYGLISVVIHEVGHSWFPMLVNSDERQWTWMDEGINTFVQFLAEQEWQDKYPSTRGEPRKLLTYFRDTTGVPIMTDGDSIYQLGNNAYAKPAVALNILRETILGRELFDYAFKTYAQRWMYKRPQPADFFRTMEDASGTDLDWFWRGWFYSNEPTDISIDNVTLYTMDSGDPDQKAERDKKDDETPPPSITAQRNEALPKRVEAHPELLDFYNEYNKYEVNEEDREKFKKALEELDDAQKALIQSAKNFYVLDLSNKGGLVMPVILNVTYDDGTTGMFRYPAEIWRYDNGHAMKLLLTDKKITQFELDPYQETGDIDTDNNAFPPKIKQKRFKVKLKEDEEKNPMQKAIEREVGDPKDKPEETPNAAP
jgi:aminopeptidase N